MLKKNYDLFIKVYHEFYQKKKILPPALENPGSATAYGLLILAYLSCLN